jgi:hypothetical protein
VGLCHEKNGAVPVKKRGQLCEENFTSRQYEGCCQRHDVRTLAAVVCGARSYLLRGGASLTTWGVAALGGLVLYEAEVLSKSV